MSACFLFWNVGGLPRQDVAARLVAAHGVDFLAVAECPDPVAFHTAIARGTRSQDLFLLPSASRVALFCRRPAVETRMLAESEKFTVLSVSFDREEFVVAAGHLPSGIAMDEGSRNIEVCLFADAVRDAERKAGHRRTIVLGDFNVNPFDQGISSTRGFHAVMDREVARRGERTVQGRTYDFFYNPMWRFFGDYGGPGSPVRRPAGTYFYGRAEHATLFWNVYDQVLLRPELMDRFDPADLSVLGSVETQSLLTSSGRPDPKVGSDHLPVLIRIKNLSENESDNANG